MLKKWHEQHGFSLTEILIAMVITMIVAAAVLTLFSSSMSSSQRLLDQGRLDRELQTIVDIIASDVQRAGFWKDADTSNNNPFMQTGTTDITINAGQDCILFTYDRDMDGVLPAITSVSDDERYGYRLNGGVIQFRPYGADFSCTAAQENWSNLTNSNDMTITAFTVTLSDQAVDIDDDAPGTETTHYRTVTVTIAGVLPNNSSVTKTITRTIKVYNNKYAP